MVSSVTFKQPTCFSLVSKVTGNFVHLNLFPKGLDSSRLKSTREPVEKCLWSLQILPFTLILVLLRDFPRPLNSANSRVLFTISKVIIGKLQLRCTKSIFLPYYDMLWGLSILLCCLQLVLAFSVCFSDRSYCLDRIKPTYVKSSVRFIFSISVWPWYSFYSKHVDDFQTSPYAIFDWRRSFLFYGGKQFLRVLCISCLRVLCISCERVLVKQNLSPQKKVGKSRVRN